MTCYRQVSSLVEAIQKETENQQARPLHQSMKLPLEISAFNKPGSSCTAHLYLLHPMLPVFTACVRPASSANALMTFSIPLSSATMQLDLRPAFSATRKTCDLSLLQTFPTSQELCPLLMLQQWPSLVPRTAMKLETHRQPISIPKSCRPPLHQRPHHLAV